MTVCVARGAGPHTFFKSDEIEGLTTAEILAKLKVQDSVLMPGAVVEPGAVLNRVIVADGVKIGSRAVVGSADSEHIELISKNVKGVE